MLSGLGSAAHLESHGIPVVADLLGVGGHLMDHPVVDVVLEDISGDSLSYFKPSSWFQTFKLLFDLGNYFITRRGPLSTNVSAASATCFWHLLVAYLRIVFF